MKRKNKRTIAHFMAFMTLFMSVFTITYTSMHLKGYVSEKENFDHSNTVYRQLEAFGQTQNSSEKEEVKQEITKDEITENDVATTDAEENKVQLSSIPKVDYVTVQDAETGNVFSLPLEEYIESVVLAEMPTNAPIEALKAQAVASRTLAVRFIKDPDKSAHNGADICTSPAHCQGYKDINVFSEHYGESVSQTVSKIKSAVLSTKGTIMVYKGEPIVAAYHASSGARTASGKEVWGGETAYLVSVETDEMYNDALKEQVISTVSFKKKDFINALKRAGVEGLEQYYDTPFSEWVSGITRTESGRADFINIAGQNIDGDDLRRILGLKSNDFSVSFTDNTISFITTGYGHGVGMSQLGAVSMAMKGESFYSILSKYYPGCTAEIM